MKRTLVILTLVAALGLVGAQAFAFGPGSGCGGCPGAGAGTVDNPEQYQQFLDQTTDLRKQAALDRAELNAVMNQDNPDQAQAREIMARIWDAQEALRAKAAELGVSGGAGCLGGGGCGGGCGGASGMRSMRGPGNGPRFQNS